jgi:hypothetical protein
MKDNYESIEYSFVTNELSGIYSDVLCTLIFPFLSAKELCVIATTSKIMNKNSSKSHIWKRLLNYDFLNKVDDDNENNLDDIDENENSHTSILIENVTNSDDNDDEVSLSNIFLNNESNYELSDEFTTNININFEIIPTKENELKCDKINIEENYKQLYINRYNNIHIDLIIANKEEEVINKKLTKQDNIQIINFWIDVIQVRLMAPILFLSLFSSIFISSLYLDGFNFSIWWCPFPLFCCFFYLLFAILLAKKIYQKRYCNDSLLHGLWDTMNGPIKLIYSEFYNESNSLVYISLSILALCLIQIIFVTIKIGISRNDIDSNLNINWGFIFFPIWILLILYCTASKFIHPGFFWSGLVLLWIPVFIIFVCLCVKFDREDNNSSGGKMKISLILLPLWLIEFFFMLVTLIFLIFGIIRVRAGLIDAINQRVAIFLTTWFILLPIIIFQSLLSSRDDGNDISARDIVIPLLILIGFFFLCSVNLFMKHKTLNLIQRILLFRELAGSKDLFSIDPGV